MNVTRQIHRINYFLPMDQRVMLYNTVIAPLFNYGDVIWGGVATKRTPGVFKKYKISLPGQYAEGESMIQLPNL